MGRKPTVVDAGQELLSVRVNISRSLWALLEKASAKFSLKPEHGLQMLMTALDRHMADPSAKVDWLWPELRSVIEAERLAWIHDKRARLDEQEAAELNAMDLAVLERSERTKSGYTGVYANGKGFRAMVKMAKGPLIALKTHETAEAAAWERYLYCQEKRIPYGELAAEMDQHRSKFDNETKLKIFAINFRRHVISDPIPGVSDEDLALADQAHAEEQRMLVASEPSARSNAAVASEPIARSVGRSDNDPMTFLGVRRSQVQAAQADATKRGAMLGFEHGLPAELKFPDE